MRGTVTLNMPPAWIKHHRKYSGAITAEKGHIVVGANTSNAFAEVLAPHAPLYMKNHSWWKSKDRPPIPHGHGVRAH